MNNCTGYRSGSTSILGDAQGWQERAVKAEQQRDELLRVLKRVLGWKFSPGTRDAKARDWADARAAVFKIEGENNDRKA